MSPDPSKDLLNVYNQFIQMATFGDWLNLVEHMGLDAHDVRTLTFYAAKLGMEIPNFGNFTNQYYISLKILYLNKRYFENTIYPENIPKISNQGEYEGYFFGLANKLYAFSQVIDNFIVVNQNFKEENKPEQINLNKYVADFIKPIPDQMIEKVLVKVKPYSADVDGKNIQQFFRVPVYQEAINEKATLKVEVSDDPFAALEGLADSLGTSDTHTSKGINLPDLNTLDTGLRGLYECSSEMWFSFLQGFIGYADYLLRVSARKNINGVTMKNLLIKPLDIFIREYVTLACKSTKPLNIEAQNRFVDILKSFVEGQLYIASSFTK
jgi:hypothetical protein